MPVGMAYVVAGGNPFVANVTAARHDEYLLVPHARTSDILTQGSRANKNGGEGCPWRCLPCPPGPSRPWRGAVPPAPADAKSVAEVKGRPCEYRVIRT